MNKEKMVTIGEKLYEELLQARGKLSALEGFGVDNWEGYDDAMGEYYGGNMEGEEG